LYGVAAAGLACALSLAACGTSPTAGGPTVTPSPTPSNTCGPLVGITDSTITLGVVFPKTGPAAGIFENFGNAAQLRINEVNAKGGINDRRVVLKTYDDRNDAKTQRLVAQQAVNDGVFGLLAASQQQTMYPALKAADIPVAGVPNLPPYATDLNVFGVYGAYSTGYTTTAVAQRFRKIKAKKIATVSLKSPGAISSARGFVATLSSQALEPALQIQTLASANSSTFEIARRIKESGADAVNVISLVESGVSLARSLKSQGATKVTVLVNGLIDPKTVIDADGSLDGAVGAPYGFVPLQLNTPEVKRYVAGMAQAGLNPYSNFAPLGYIAADLMIAGLTSAGQCPTREDFIRIQRGVTDYTGGNLLPGRISFAPGVTPDGDPAKCMWFATVRGDSILPDTGPTCGQLLKVQ
jgi:ABC-type branched-subunit amino acid transport system substrate-binding protein